MLIIGVIVKIKDLKIKYLGNDQRTRDLRINSMIMMACKGLAILINLLYVPLLIDAMSVERYGIWLTLTSIVSWLFMFDIGIGHGVRNKVASAIANGNKVEAKSIISSGYGVLSIIVVVLVVLTCSLFPLFSWSSILNAPTEMNQELTFLAIVVVSCFCLQLLFKLVDSVLYALQKPMYASLLLLLHQALGLLLIFLMKSSGKSYSLLQYGSVISVIPIAVLFIATLIIFIFFYPNLAPSIKYISQKHIGDVLGLGLKFLFIQLTAVILFQTNTFIIAHGVNSEAVVHYNIAYKYFGVINMLFSTLTAPVWSATTDAFARKDYKWIEKTCATLNKIFNKTLIISFIMLIIAPFVYKLWLHDSIDLRWWLMVFVLVYQLLNMKTGIYASIINGIGKIKLQFLMTTIECLIHIPLAIALCKYWGIYGVLTSMTFVTVINLIWEPVQVNKIIHGTAKGIWNK